MKITRKQLRRLIAESFIGAPDGTVYTQRTKRVHSEYGEVMGDDSTDEMDVPVVYGQDSTKVATPRLYGVLTRNWHKIHRFHEKGPQLYKVLMNPETDPENKKYFLYQLNTFDIITDKELEDVNLDIDLLADPNFQAFRDQSAARLEKKHYDEIFADIKKQRELSKNPDYIKYSKKQIDDAIDGAFEYFKDMIKEEFFNSMYDYKEKGHKPAKIGFNPDEGMEPLEMAIHITYGVLEESEVFEKTYDATLYNNDLYQYRSEKSIEQALHAIDALVGAGILEETADGKVRMSERSYKIDLNNMRGRVEDFHKQRGTRSAFSDDPYKPNPNLPVVTEAMIRQFIREAFKQKVPLFDPVSQGEIDALRQSGRQDANLSGLSPRQISNLQTLDQSTNPASVNQARQLYSALGSTEPDISVEQEQDFLDTQDDYLVDLQDYNIEQALEDVFVNGNRDPKLLKQLGFTRFEDEDPNYRRSLMKSNSWYYEHIEAILNKPIDDLMYVESVSYNTSRFFYSIKHFLDNNFKNYPAQNGLLKVYNKKAKTTDVVAAQSFAVGFMIGGNEMIFI